MQTFDNQSFWIFDLPILQLLMLRLTSISVPITNPRKNLDVFLGVGMPFEIVLPLLCIFLSLRTCLRSLPKRALFFITVRYKTIKYFNVSLVHLTISIFPIHQQEVGTEDE